MRRAGRMRLRGRLLILGTLFALLSFLDTTGFTVMTLLAILLHEAGHLLAAKRLGIPWRGFSMDFTGARMEISGRMISFFEEWLLSAAGPFAGLIFAALGAIFWKYTQWAVWFSCASLLLSLLNLLVDLSLLIRLALEHLHSEL